jgi:hypothetical protein
MRPYVVTASVPNTFIDFRVPGHPGGDGRFGFYATHDKSSGGESDRNQILWFFDTQLSAELFANWIAGHHPGIEYGVGHIGLVCQSTPGPVVKSKYTPQGLLPA